MKLEVIKQGKKIDEVEIELPDGNTLSCYNLRSAILELEINTARRIYPYAELWLVFESKMNELWENQYSHKTL